MLGQNYITVDNPNVLPTSNPGVPLGQKISVQTAESGVSGVELTDIFLPHATLRTMRGSFNQNAVFVNQRNEGSHLIASCFFFDGHVTSALKGSQKGVILKKDLQTLKYDPHNEYLHWCTQNKPFHIAHLSIEPEYLFGLLPDDEQWSLRLRERVEKRQRVLADVPPVISAAQHRALQNIVECPLTGKLGLLMMETSIIQLMLLLVQAQFMEDTSGRERLSLRDKDLVEGIKEYITRTFLQEHSITDLARHFGTNTNKLMSLFKKVFGMSIFEYISDLKMEYAKRLLLDEGRYVVEVSRCIGYKNPHHFSTAFKRKFGINPSRLKYA